MADISGYGFHNFSATYIRIIFSFILMPNCIGTQFSGTDIKVSYLRVSGFLLVCIVAFGEKKSENKNEPEPKK